MVSLYPFWITPSGALSSVTQGTNVSVSLSASRQAVFMAQQGQNVVDIGENANAVTSVLVNTQTVLDYQLEGNTVVFATNLSQTDLVDITTSDPITYSLLHDSLPPGLSLNASGTISGTVGTILSKTPVNYTFTVRIFDGTSSRDRQFSMVAYPSSANVAPPGWGSGLPSKQIENATPNPFAYVPLGQATRGSTFDFQLDLYEPSNLPPILELEFFLGAASVTSPFDTMPPGLSLNQTTGLISGTIDPSAELGSYFFNIAMLDYLGNPVTQGTGATPLTFGIQVQPPLQPLIPLRFMIWQTAAGSLATLYEGVAFPIGVTATCSTGEAVSYTLADNTVLPPGLTLDASTGEIQGIIGHVLSDTVYNFTIRAFVGQTFSDRNFSITVLSRYASASFVDMTFRLRVKDTVPMASFYNSIIQTGQYFRLGDANYPNVTIGNSPMSVLIIGGLAGSAGEFESLVRSSNFDGPLNLLLGEHKIAYATINGAVIYEVLYREIIDPMAGAGGYIINNGIPSQNLILYPESAPSNPVYVYPNSINNIRCEFLLACGFPTVDSSIEYDLDLSSGAENLPLWMTCPQTGTDTTTALGYIPAIPLAYLQPGAGQLILEKINDQIGNFPAERPHDPSNAMAIGHLSPFDQYYVIFQTISSATTFDVNTTTFDGGTIVFDVFAYSGGQYFRMNREMWNTTNG